MEEAYLDLDIYLLSVYADVDNLVLSPYVCSCPLEATFINQHIVNKFLKPLKTFPASVFDVSIIIHDLILKFIFKDTVNIFLEIYSVQTIGYFFLTVSVK